MAEKIKEDEKPKQTMTDVIANIYRHGTEYDAGKVITIAKSVVATIKKSDYLYNIAKNDKQGLVDCINHAISLGLTIDANQYCYLVPYNCKINGVWKKKIQLQVGYKGYIHKILKAYPKVKIQACLVKEGDTIEIRKEENNDYVNHSYKNPFEQEEKGKERKIIGVYSIITFPDGKSIVETLNKNELDLIKSKTKTKEGKTDNNGKIILTVWQEWYGEMCKKSVIRRACKIHFSSEVVDLNVFDNKMYDVSTKPLKLPKTAGLEAKNNEL